MIRITPGPIMPGRCGSQAFVPLPVGGETILATCCLDLVGHPDYHEFRQGGTSPSAGAGYIIYNIIVRWTENDPGVVPETLVLDTPIEA